MAGTRIPDQLLTTAQVGERLGFSQEHALRLADAGEIPVAAFAGTNGMRLFAIPDVERFARERAERKAVRACRRQERASRTREAFA
jgi:hypothetical protein